MKDLQKYLEKFKNLLGNKVFIESCCENVFKELNLPISKKDFDVVGGVIRLKSKNPVMKSELKLKKNKILKSVNLCLGKEGVFDIY